MFQVQFRSQKGTKRSFGRFGDKQVVSGRNEETKHMNQGFTVNYGGHRNLQWP
ncbi:hypothetical protein HanIR_Chr08g0352831 [Helianthus annuus]|nr:hypothetical protein HanIR_Chr08g0352831 [Helianthus annuus]